MEYPHLPLVVKNEIMNVLFQKFSKTISIIPQPLSAVLSFGSMSGLVIDLGYLESRVYLVYDGRIMDNLTGFYPIGTYIVYSKTRRKENYKLDQGNSQRIRNLENIWNTA